MDKLSEETTLLVEILTLAGRKNVNVTREMDIYGGYSELVSCDHPEGFIHTDIYLNFGLLFSLIPKSLNVRILYDRYQKEYVAVIYEDDVASEVYGSGSTRLKAFTESVRSYLAGRQSKSV
jgi:hypothetical protein